MKCKLKKYTNEGAILIHEGEELLLKKRYLTPFKDFVEIKSFSKEYYIADNEPREGQLRALKIKAKTNVGFFLDTKTPIDLFVPFKESHKYSKEGDMVAVKVLKDFKNRLYATMNLKKYLQNKSNYKENDNVSGMVYSIKKGLGIFVVVDEKYDAMLDYKEADRSYEIGDVATFRVEKIHDDGKIKLSLRQRKHLQMDKDACIILDRLNKVKKIDLGDKSKPEMIFNEFKMSKQAFKRAVGRLLKKGLIDAGDYYIRRKI